MPPSTFSMTIMTCESFYEEQESDRTPLISCFSDSLITFSPPHLSDANWCVSSLEGPIRQSLLKTSEQLAPVSWWIHQFIHQSITLNSTRLTRFQLLNVVWDRFLKNWQTHSRSPQFFALCKGSCNCNELQSGLFGMLLIFNANIWGVQAFWAAEEWQPKFLPLPVQSYPPTALDSGANFLPCLSQPSARLSWPFSALTLSRCFRFPPSSVAAPPLPRRLSLCSTESNGDRPSPTGLRWRPTLRRWSVSPISSALSLPPSVPSPSAASPILFVTPVDTLTGRDSQTSQFPPGLGYFALGLQRDFQLTRLYTHTHAHIYTYRQKKKKS